MFCLFKYTVISKAMITKQLKEECIYRKQLIACLEKDPYYQQLTTNKQNQISHQSGELSPEYILRRTNERADGANASMYKALPASYADRSKAKRQKAQLELLVKAVDYIIDKSDLENELSNLLD